MKRIHRLAAFSVMLVAIDQIAFSLWGSARLSGQHLTIICAVLTWAMEDK